MHNLQISALLALCVLSGCMSMRSTNLTDQQRQEAEARAARCLPHTGCASRDETPEQFEQRKIIEEATAKDEQIKSAQKEKDLSVCKYEAAKATASSQTGYTLYSTIFNDTTNTFKQAELITLCMKSKGWAG